MTNLPRERRVAVSMICGDGWQPDEIKELLASLEPWCHALYVNWNGTKHKPRWGNWTSMPVHYITTAWEDDFAKARQAAYMMIPKDEYGWWMWVDADDKLVAPEGFAPVWEMVEAEPYMRGAMMWYAYGLDEFGNVVVEQWRERLMSLDWVWQWKWPIHELCNAPQGTPFAWAPQDRIYIEHQRRHGDDRGAKDRNRRIISRERRLHPEEPRHAYYYASECMRETELAPVGSGRRRLLADAAIIEFQKYLYMVSERGPTDESYGAACRIGELFLMKEDGDGALDAFLQAAKFYPHWPDAWVGCAKACWKLQDWGRMLTFASLSEKLPKPRSAVALESLDYGYSPAVMSGIASEELGFYREALGHYRRALEFHNDPRADLNERIVVLEKKLVEPEKPDPMVERRARLGTSQKSICFFTNPISETWNQQTLSAGGHGGAETMVLELAPMFAADGWRVAVFGCPGDQIGVGDDGVEYWRSEDWMPVEPWTVFVSSRAGTPFVGPIEAKQKYLWMHDVNVGPWLRTIAGRQNKIVALSNWHVQHLMSLYGIPSEHFAIIPNGIDLALYPPGWVEGTDGHKFVWSSSPDRGLQVLLQLWPYIRDLLPDATLDIFYGFAFIDKLIAMQPDHPLVWIKQEISDLYESIGGEEGGVFWRDRVSPTELATYQIQSDVWAYPTNFMETFCITAIQAQAAGCIPITSGLAALEETVACPWLKINGWPANVDYQNRYLRLLETVFSDTSAATDLRAQARRLGREHAEKFTLENSYTAWRDLLIKEGL